MTVSEQLAKVVISAKSHRLLHQLLNENPKLHDILLASRTLAEVTGKIRTWATSELEKNPAAVRFYHRENIGRELFAQLQWRDYGTIRILDYIDNSGRVIFDQNRDYAPVVINPFELLWLAATTGTGGAKPDFFRDMIELFRQFTGVPKKVLPDREMVSGWMARHPSGLDPAVIELRRENRKRIINVIIDLIDSGEKTDTRYSFEPGLARAQKFDRVSQWWNENLFHLRFAARTPRVLNLMLGESLDPDDLEMLERARAAGIPFFVNPHYISLLNVRAPDFAVASDMAIRDYVIYSPQLVEEFGRIVAWEKEDRIEPGKPNAAGWLLPVGNNVHRRYPDAAILIPNTRGRACGGLCTACQRMYNFQKGRQSFDFDHLRPRKTWKEKLVELMAYFEEDSMLRDILITGGDAFMSTDSSLQRILDAVYEMALRKRDANQHRADGQKYAEMTRVRLATRLLAYLPQRISPELRDILSAFREKALTAGITQFFIQTHFESAMEITPEARNAIRLLQDAGWVVTNQHVLTTASSRRGHNARLRQVLCELGVLPYYTFSVKGFKENHQLFSTAARILQEVQEEKFAGEIPAHLVSRIGEVQESPTEAARILNDTMKEANLPFLASDRSISNLPGVGKSLSFRVIGITRNGQRILEFEHDRTRRHSPIIEQMEPFVFVECKSIAEYVQQVADMGENTDEYNDLFGYSLGATEARCAVFEYTDYGFETTEEMTNLKLTAE